MSRAAGLEAAFRRTATAKGRAAEGAFAIEGLRLFERALNAGARIRGALLSRSFGDEPGSREAALADRLTDAQVPVERADEAKLANLMEGRGGGAAVGVVERPAQPAWPASAAAWPGGDLLVGYEVEDPGNVGALVRTALAGGAAGYLRVGSGDPFHPKAVRTSMGSLFRLQVSTAGADWIERLRATGLRLLGAATFGGTPLPQAEVGSSGTAWIVGSEAFGIPRATLDLLDGAVTIPMTEDVDSYSVNASAAILLYETLRRKSVSPSRP